MRRQRLSIVGLLSFLAVLAVACAGAATRPAPDLAPTGDESTLDALSGGDPSRPSSGDGNGNGTNQAPVPANQLIVYTGSMDLEVADIDAAISQAQQLITGLGGHVAASNTSDHDSGKSATVTYRIPAERWAEALTGMRALATKIVNESTESEDVTAQVVDLDARLANLRVTETALQAIMDRATTITDVLKVQAELTDVRSDIESLTAQRDLLANRAALATLQVGFNVPVAEIQIASDQWDLGKEIERALAALVRVGQGAVSLAIWVAIVLLPIFAPIVLIIYVAYVVRRRWLRSKHEAALPVE